MTPTIHDQLKDMLEEAQQKAEVGSLRASFLDGVAFGLRKALEVAPPDATELRDAIATYLTETLPSRVRHYEDNPQETPPASDALRLVGHDLHNILGAYDAVGLEGDVTVPDYVERGGLFAREDLRPALEAFYAEVRDHIASCMEEVAFVRSPSWPQGGQARHVRIVRIMSCQDTFERVAHRIAEILGVSYRVETDDAAGE